MFQRAAESRGEITIVVDGEAVAARLGDSIAAALIAAGIAPLRSTVISDSPRAPYCMMGVCFDCLATVDGVTNRQTCLIPVRDGMRIERQHGKRELP